VGIKADLANWKKQQYDFGAVVAWAVLFVSILMIVVMLVGD
jgi:hypothetical protein